MRFHDRPDLAPLEAYAASLRAWLVSVLAWFVDTFAPAARGGGPIGALLASLAPRLRADLRATASDLRYVLFLRAYARLRLSGRIRNAAHPHGAPTGVRVQRVACGLHTFIGGTLRGLNRGSLHERARRLAHILDNPERFIARIVARLEKLFGRLRAFSLVLAFAPRERVRDAARAADLCFVDTS